MTSLIRSFYDTIANTAKLEELKNKKYQYDEVNGTLEAKLKYVSF
jgi:hypothetical protein